jgi:hypothetical protein
MKCQVCGLVSGPKKPLKNWPPHLGVEAPAAGFAGFYGRGAHFQFQNIWITSFFYGRDWANHEGQTSRKMCNLNLGSGLESGSAFSGATWWLVAGWVAVAVAVAGSSLFSVRCALPALPTARCACQ